MPRLGHRQRIYMRRLWEEGGLPSPVPAEIRFVLEGLQRLDLVTSDDGVWVLTEAGKTLMETRRWA